jgi:subtilisin family serine protease
MSWELRLKDFEEKRNKEKRKLEEETKYQYLVVISEKSDYVKKLYEGEVEIYAPLLRDLANFGKIIKVYKFFPIVLVEVEAGRERDFKSYISNLDSEKIYSEANSLVSIPSLDSLSGSSSTALRGERLWNLEMVQAYKTQKELTKGSGQVVAVIDTGADYTHPEIEKNFRKEKGYNVLAKNDDPFDDCYIPHGTHCSGIVAGTTVGVAPGVTLYAVKFLNEWGWGTLADAIEAVEWCIKKGDVTITSNSWGSHTYSRALEVAFEKAWENNIINVAAAGNSGDRRKHYPSCYKSVISVPAVDRYERRAPFSTMNECNEVAAPGVEIYSCVRDGKYEKLSGTSMACPHVAGGAALVRAFNWGTKERTRESLKRRAKKLGPKEEYGEGLLQTYDSTLYYY